MTENIAKMYEKIEKYKRARDQVLEQIKSRPRGVNYISNISDCNNYDQIEEQNNDFNFSPYDDEMWIANLELNIKNSKNFGKYYGQNNNLGEINNLSGLE